MGSPFDEYSKTNIDLHETIIAFGGNKRAENFYQMLSMQILLVNRSTPWRPAIFCALPGSAS